MSSLFARGGAPVIVTVISIALVAFLCAFISRGPAALYFRLFAAGMFVFLLFTFYFFRDPDRTAPPRPEALFAPADGTILSVKDVEEPRYMKSKARRVSIFMSVFNVHVNRAPLGGTIDFLHYNTGKFISAFKEKASEDNESLFVGMQAAGSPTKIAFKIIAGLIARRIIFYKSKDDVVTQGERINLIRFGSRVDLYCPAGSEIKVQVGDKVTAGETVIAIMQEN